MLWVNSSVALELGRCAMSRASGDCKTREHPSSGRLAPAQSTPAAPNRRADHQGCACPSAPPVHGQDPLGVINSGLLCRGSRPPPAVWRAARYPPDCLVDWVVDPEMPLRRPRDAQALVLSYSRDRLDAIVPGQTKGVNMGQKWHRVHVASENSARV